MKRYYLSDLIGSGAEDDPYRPAVDRPGVGYSAVYPPQDPATGQYQGAICLVIVEAANHLPLVADRRNDAFPDFPIDGRMSALAQARRDALRAFLARRGLDVGNIDSYDGYRNVIRAIGRKLDPNFHEDNFDVL